MLSNYAGMTCQHLFKRRPKSKNEMKGPFRKKEPVLLVAVARSYPGLAKTEVSIPAKLLLFSAITAWSHKKCLLSTLPCFLYHALLISLLRPSAEMHTTAGNTSQKLLSKTNMAHHQQQIWQSIKPHRKSVTYQGSESSTLMLVFFPFRCSFFTHLPFSHRSWERGHKTHCWDLDSCWKQRLS